MNQVEIERKEKELREKYPKSFSYPGIRPGEVCLGFTPFELQCTALRRGGLTTVRMAESDVTTEAQVSSGGGSSRTEQVGCWALFADLKEYIIYRYGRK